MSEGSRGEPPVPSEDEVLAWLRSNWNACTYDDLPYAMACYWAEWGWRQSGIILSELCAARQLALRCGHDPDAVTPPYLDALSAHFITTTETDDNN